MLSPRARVDAAASFLAGRGAEGTRIGLVLGSGLGAFADGIDVRERIPYDEIPGFPTVSVQGHGGQLVLGQSSDIPVAVLQGRVHAYEGYSWEEVVFAVRSLCALGTQAMVLTNAAGGVNAAFSAGNLMLITDHINLSGGNPLTGPNEASWGPRFPDMTYAYRPAVCAAIDRAALDLGVPLRRGVYAGLSGPTYETPAEIQMLRALGADAVGMSTVAECIAINHMGVKVGGISCITNMAAGMSGKALSHDEVKETADRVRDRFVRLLEASIPAIDQAVAEDNS